MIRFVAISFLLCAAASAADADAAWQALTSLDAGPQRKPKTPAEVRSIPLSHGVKQETAAREFLRDFPNDARAVEARLRLARVLQLRAQMQDQGVTSKEVESLLQEAERLASPAQRPDVDFARVSYAMRTLSGPDSPQRTRVLDMARKFQHTYPEDRRVGALLVEVSTLFDLQPRTKRELLIDAQRATTDEDLKDRIADDLRRVDLVGQTFDLRFVPPTGPALDVADHRGKVVLVVFFASWSPPSVEAVDTLRKSVAALPPERVQLFGVSLDTERAPLEGFVTSRKITWPVICDGKSWDSTMVRALGINALPTVWIVDAEGRLRSLNGAMNTAAQVREALR